LCAEGLFQENSGTTGCVDCDIGRYAALAGSVSCVDCGGGEQQVLTGQATCDPCMYGKFKDSVGTEECQNCSSGTFTSSETTLFTCALCDMGRAQHQPGSTSCDICTEGKFQKTTGQAECDDCVIGKYTNDLGNFACTQCEPGKIQYLEGQPECESCLAGTYMPFVGSSNATCIECPIGMISSTDGSSECVICSSSIDFQSEPGQSSCYSCMANAVANTPRTACLCKIGYYAIDIDDILLFQQVDDDSYESYLISYIQADPMPPYNPNEIQGFFCALCPEGADCQQVGTTLSSVNASESFFVGVDESGIVFLPCFFEDACGEEGVCAEGYAGVACAECADNLILNDDYVRPFSFAIFFVIHLF